MSAEAPNVVLNGRRHTLWATASRLRGLDGSVSGAIESIRDVTEWRNAEARRLELERQLLYSQRLDSLGVLAGGVAHDFNGLFTVIQGNIGLAMKDASAGRAMHEVLAEAMSAAKRAAALTAQMLAYSGKGRFVVGPLSLTVLVTKSAPLLEAAAPSNVSLTFDLDDQVPLIEADARQMEQALVNLTNNAFERLMAVPVR